MCKVIGKLTVFFEEPFLVGVFERYENGKLSVAKVTFGAEPKDNEVCKFILEHYYDLKFSKAVEATAPKTKKNTKRVQRDARKQLQETGIGKNHSKLLKCSRNRTNSSAKKKAVSKNSLMRSECMS